MDDCWACSHYGRPINGGLDERWCLLLRSLNFLWHFPRTSLVVAFNRSAMNFDLACLLLFFLQVSRRRMRRILNRAFNFYSLSFFFPLCWYWIIYAMTFFPCEFLVLKETFLLDIPVCWVWNLNMHLSEVRKWYSHSKGRELKCLIFIFITSCTHILFLKNLFSFCTAWRCWKV